MLDGRHADFFLFVDADQRSPPTKEISHAAMEAATAGVTKPSSLRRWFRHILTRCIWLTRNVLATKGSSNCHIYEKNLSLHPRLPPEV